MVKDSDKEYRETMQEIMLELKIKTEKLFRKLQEETKKFKFKF